MIAIVYRMEQEFQTIPNRLRIYRIRYGYSQHDLARLLGLRTTSQISQWENGSIMPSATNLFKLSILYRTIPNELYYDFLFILREELKNNTLQICEVQIS